MGQLSRSIAENSNFDLLSPFYLLKIDSLTSRLGEVEVSIPVPEDVLARYSQILILEAWSFGTAFLLDPTAVDVSNGEILFRTSSVSITSNAIDEFYKTVPAGPDFGPPETPVEVGFAVVGCTVPLQQSLRTLATVERLSYEVQMEWITVKGDCSEEDAWYVIRSIARWLQGYKRLGITWPKGQTLTVLVHKLDKPGQFNYLTNNIDLDPESTRDDLTIGHELLHWIHFNNYFKNGDPLRRLWAYVFGATAFVEGVASWAPDYALDEQKSWRPSWDCLSYLQWSPYIIDDGPCPQKECGWLSLNCRYSTCQFAKYAQEFLLFSYARRHGPQAIVEAINRGETQPYDKFWTEDEWEAAMQWILEILVQQQTDWGYAERSDVVRLAFPTWKNGTGELLRTRPSDRLELGPLTAYLAVVHIGSRDWVRYVEVARTPALDTRIRVAVIGKGLKAESQKWYTKGLYKLSDASEAAQFTFAAQERGKIFVLLWRSGSDALNNQASREFVDIYKSLILEIRSEEPVHATLTVEVTPQPVTIRPGGLHAVTYTFRESSGCQVELPERTGQFYTPSGEALTVESGRMTQSITVPARGETSWVDNIYLPPEVASQAKARGLSEVVLRARFYGHDCSNNQVSVSADLRIRIDAGCPDLVVQEIWIEPAQFSANQEVTVWFRAKNIGNADAGGFRIVVSLDGRVIDAGDVHGLSAGKELRGWVTPVIWPDSNCHTVGITLDSMGAIAECSEENNTLSRVFCPAQGCPDLAMEDIWIEPAQFSPGQQLTLWLSARNTGTAPAGPFRIAIRFDGMEIDSATVQGLGAGKAIRGEKDDLLWPSDSNCHTIEVILDPENVVSECKENNNRLSKRFCPSAPPQKPDLVVEKIELEVQSEPPPWTTFNVIVAIRNVGGGAAQGPFKVALYRFEQPVTGDWKFLGETTVSQLAPGESQRWTWCCIGMPDPPPIDWWERLLAIVDPTNNVQETNENNNTLERCFGSGCP
jgi:hypothetical protein